MENSMNEKNVVAQETAEQTAQNNDSTVENEKKKEKAKGTNRRKTVECRVDHANKLYGGREGIEYADRRRIRLRTAHHDEILREGS